MAAKPLEPIHPGEILHEEFMKPMEMSSNALARSGRRNIPNTV
jgi:plasmid maintenance system antidote protein VapI